MLRCRDITEMVTDYSEEELSAWRRFNFKMHLAMCSHCRRYYAQMRLTVEQLAKLPQTPLPPQKSESVLKIFRKWKKKRASES